MSESLEELLGDRSPQIIVDGKKVAVPQAADPLGARRMSAVDIMKSIEEALSSDYTGKDVQKIGLTKAAAAFLALAEKAQDGDGEALEKILNRLIGKPIQQINSFNVSASLSEFLGGLAKEMSQPEPFIDAEVDPLGD